MRRIRQFAHLVALAAVTCGSLLSGTSSAEAAGNCYHYGSWGYVQFFTQPNYGGDCLEFYVGGGSSGTGSLAASAGSEWMNNISSIRGWAPVSLNLYTSQSWTGSRFDWYGTQSWPTLPSWIDNKSQSLDWSGQ